MWLLNECWHLLFGLLSRLLIDYVSILQIASDFAFLPFGGGQRRCIGDQFAMMESLVTLVMLLRSYDFEMAIHPNEIGMKTGATIHTAKGLPVRVKRRKL